MIYHVKSGSLDCVVEAPDNTSAMDIAVQAIKQEMPESMGLLTEVSGGQYCGDDVTYTLTTTVLERAGLLDALCPANQAEDQQDTTEVEFEVWQDGEMVAGGTAPNSKAVLQKADHYARMYRQDGPVEVRFFVRQEVLRAELEAQQNTQP